MYGKFQKILTGKVQFLRLSSKLLNLSIPYATKVECLKLDFSRYIIWEGEHCIASRFLCPFLNSKSFVSQTNCFKTDLWTKIFKRFSNLFIIFIVVARYQEISRLNDKVSHFNYNFGVKMAVHKLHRH